jgi:Zn-dependent protease with chaperone function
MTFGKSLSYERYWTPSWKVFIWLALATIVPIFFIVAIVGAKGCRGCPPPHMVDLVQMALFISAPFTILGLITGLVRNLNAKEVVGKAVGASYLDSSHALTQRVHQLSDRLQLPRPQVGVMQAANAYAVGRTPRDAAVIIGQPLLRQLNADELDAVIGHELGHIASGDMNRMQLATGFQLAFDWFFRAIGVLVGMALRVAAQTSSRHASGAQIGLIVSNLCATIAKCTVAIGSTVCIYALSRRREYYADAVGAMLTSPDTMRRALQKIHHVGDRPLPGESEHRMLMFRSWAGRTHPSLEARLAALNSGNIMNRVERRFQDGGRANWKPIEIPDGVKVAGIGLIAAVLAFAVIWKLLPG